MSDRTVLIVCRECAGTGDAPDSYLQCEYCLGQCHINVDRATDGGIPEGEREWCGPVLGKVQIHISPD